MYDAIVVGAGIVGAACADALAADGLAVLVLDTRFAGAGTTAAGMGHLVVMDDSEAEFALTAYSRDLWRERAASLPADCEDDPCGTVWVAANDEEMSSLPAKLAFYRDRGVRAQIWDEATLRSNEPHLRAGLAGGFFVPDDRVLYPPNAARWLVEQAMSRGAALREGAAVSRIETGRAVLANGEAIDASVIVNAAGIEAPRLCPGVPITPRKGHLIITDRYPRPVKRQLVELGYLTSAHTLEPESVAFNVQPRTTGQLLVGSSREFVGTNTEVNPRILSRMIDRAASYMPMLRGLSAIRVWTGFRPATPDKLPFIGEWDEGIVVAAGHEGLGISTSLATGQLVADLVAGRRPAVDPSPYAPHRSIASSH
jgi:D-hydroxyproline dehydrogenase subunit beta